MSLYKFTLTGLTPLLMHADNIEWADQMQVWKDTADNKRDSKAGDDRSPAFRWFGSLYHDGEIVAIPSECLARGLMTAGARVPIPGGKNGKTFKQNVMSSMAIQEAFIPLTGPNGLIKVVDLKPLLEEKLYENHVAAVRNFGFSLFAKRARVGTSKHIRVRPRFDRWAIAGTVEVWDEKLEKALPKIFQIAGSECGLGDWRPSAPTPGPFGRFLAEVSRA